MMIKRVLYIGGVGAALIVAYALGSSMPSSAYLEAQASQPTPTQTADTTKEVPVTTAPFTGLASSTWLPVQALARSVAATVETDPVPNTDDAADDSAIWVHPTNPALSTIIGTDKKGGLAVYDLAGKQLQYLSDGRLNNVDLRTDFQLGGQSVALVTAGNRSNNGIAIYQIDPATRLLQNVAARAVTTLKTYGSCMYRSSRTGKYYYFVNSEQGEVEQWELVATGTGQVDARLVRDFDVGTQTEGCVADDELGHFYIGEEAVGIWKYGAEPDAAPDRRQVDTTGTGGHLTADVEGLTIAYGSGGSGYLIASSQGNNSFAVYRREGNNEYLTSFTIVDGNGIDGVSDTDGIDVTMQNLGPSFPQGVFVAQDGANDSGNQNYKLVPWHLITGSVPNLSATTPSTIPPSPTIAASSTPVTIVASPTPTPISTAPAPTGQQSAPSHASALQAVRARFPDALIHELELENEAGLMVYEVELTSAGKAYEVEVDAANAQILKVEDEELDAADSPGQPRVPQAAPSISLDQAVQAALARFPDARVGKAERDNEDGVLIYEVELVAGSKQHEVEIDAVSGSVLNIESEERD
jgi:3-phytase